jgi:hypothetical protein
MGTTVSTNLGLIKPDGDESIKANLPTFDGWAAQNTVNMDKIDALFRSNNTTYTLNWTAATANPTLGAGGFTEGKFVRLFPRMVLVFFRVFNGAAGFAAGTGQYRINLPVAADPALTAFSEVIPIGKAVFYDVSAALTSSVFTANLFPGGGYVVFRPAIGDTWSNVLPVVPGQNDRLSGYLLYPTAAA